MPHVTVAYDTSPEHDGPVAAVLARQGALDGKIDGVLFGTFNIKGGCKIEKIPFQG